MWWSSETLQSLQQTPCAHCAACFRVQLLAWQQSFVHSCRKVTIQIHVSNLGFYLVYIIVWPDAHAVHHLAHMALLRAPRLSNIHVHLQRLYSKRGCWDLYGYLFRIIYNTLDYITSFDDYIIGLYYAIFDNQTVCGWHCRGSLPWCWCASKKSSCFNLGAILKTTITCNTKMLKHDFKA